ncbi:hypothetical protein BH20ACT2_BH20ACT2_14810 [soil metagenome]
MRRSSTGRSVAAVTAFLLALGVSGCSELDLVSLPPPSSTTPDQATTTVPLAERASVTLPEVPGTTLPTPVPAEGQARLAGVVTAPGGAVPGATVRVEQLVGAEARVRDVMTDGGGRWEAPGIAGGRYRVRAFRAPDLIQVEPEVFFLAGDDDRRLDLRLEEGFGQRVSAAIAPDPPVVGRAANLVVQVTDGEVGTDGVARDRPVAGLTVGLIGGSGYDLRTSSTVVTGSDGRARFQIECTSPGASGLAVRLGTPAISPRPTPTSPGQPAAPTTSVLQQLQTVGLDLAACVSPAPTTTVPSTGSTSSTVGDGTTGTGSTTTTTER